MQFSPVHFTSIPLCILFPNTLSLHSYLNNCIKQTTNLNILPLQSQYILSLAMFVVGNFKEFSINSDIHSFNTRQKSHLHPPSTRMTKFQKGIHYMGVKIFNKLPPKTQYLSGNNKQFPKTLKNFLLLGSFYTLEEFYNWPSISELRAAYLQYWIVFIKPNTVLTFWLRDAPTSLTFNNCTLCPLGIYVLCKQRLVPLTA
jgi:hypothetical protein